MMRPPPRSPLFPYTALFRSEVLNTVPVQAPLQPANTEPGSGCANRVTTSPVEYLCAPDAPQAIPAVLLVTVPLPVPALVAVRVTGGAALKVAVQLLAAPIVT